MCIYNIQYIYIYNYIRTQYHNHIYMHACVISNYIYKHLRKHAPIHRRSHTHHFPQQPTMSHVHQTCPAKGRRLRWVPATRLVRSYAIYFRLGVLKSPRKMWYKDIQGKFRQLMNWWEPLVWHMRQLGNFFWNPRHFQDHHQQADACKCLLWYHSDWSPWLFATEPW